MEKNELHHPAHTNSSVPIKRYVLYVLVGGLVISALISIIAVLVGEFGDTAGRALGTTVLIVIHSLLGLLFLSVKKERSLSSSVIINTLFGVLIASMATSVLGTWDIFSSDIVGDLYLVYFLALTASLLVSALLTTHLKDKVVQGLAWSSIGAVLASFGILLPWVFEDLNYILPDVYYRIVAALSILTATLIVLTVIFDRLYVVKHPELKAARDPHAMPLGLKIFLIVIAVIFGGGLILPGIIAGMLGLSY